MLEILVKEYDLNILVRLHPNENYADYADYFNKYQFLTYSNEILNLEESLAISDMVLVESSTVALEAVACDKKVFTYKQDNEYYYSVPAFTKPPFVFSNNLKELEGNLISYLSCNNKTSNNGEFMPKGSIEKIVELLTKNL